MPRSCWRAGVGEEGDRERQVLNLLAAGASDNRSGAQQWWGPYDTSPNCNTQFDPNNKYSCATVQYWWDSYAGTWTVTRFGWNGSLGQGGYDNGWRLDHGDIWDEGCNGCGDWRNPYHYYAEANWHYNQTFVSRSLAFENLNDWGIRYWTVVYHCFAHRQQELRDPSTGRVTRPATTDYTEWKGTLQDYYSAFYSPTGCPP